MLGRAPAEAEELGIAATEPHLEEEEGHGAENSDR